MRAVQISTPGGIEHLKLVDIPEPAGPQPGEIRVRVHASSLNFHDLGVANRTNPKFFGQILMADGAGVVDAVGAGVTEFNIGDAVVSCFYPTWQDGPASVGGFATVPGDGVDGYAAEFVVRPATWFTRAPAGYSHAEAATLTTAGLTAWRALVADAGIKAGDTILILGTGGASIFALQFAKVMGARVIATSSSDEKLRRVRELGADLAINYVTHPSWGELVLEWTNGRGVDQVIEVGGPGTLAQSILATRIGGQISLIGTLTGYRGEISTMDLIRKQLRLQGLIVGSRRQQQQMVAAIEATGLRPVIDRTFRLEQLTEAFEYEKSGQHFGKICIDI